VNERMYLIDLMRRLAIFGERVSGWVDGRVGEWVVGDRQTDRRADRQTYRLTD
jgi:hypothetical protein